MVSIFCSRARYHGLSTIGYTQVPSPTYSRIHNVPSYPIPDFAHIIRRGRDPRVLHLPYDHLPILEYTVLYSTLPYPLHMLSFAPHDGQEDLRGILPTLPYPTLHKHLTHRMMNRRILEVLYSTLPYPRGTQPYTTLLLPCYVPYDRLEHLRGNLPCPVLPFPSLRYACLDTYVMTGK